MVLAHFDFNLKNNSFEEDYCFGQGSPADDIEPAVDIEPADTEAAYVGVDDTEVLYFEAVDIGAEVVDIGVKAVYMGAEVVDIGIDYWISLVHLLERMGFRSL